ncbi:Dihydrolipoyllysine-residue acetyltransferase component of pyruvate dehydrogenase complex [Arthrobacter sp. Bi83]|uniref:dihydrolipoamide acetyltransferase family protein n=1 Tax=Arthrobacter sp. Bi83 TaxID=2822353 RepID=UPI001D5C4D2D|nr:dihydrolipoamide acetyltransferase family protein [Arthrobacter sp. Bi83]CAH0296423.1 Dihydrolipoyllysine-residue acetyltransferase component of pyruvate dehydrogenase complex [Arthrobacter sp. Bi83]
MATIITMPAVVADATEAALQDWLVKIGDTIAAGQPIAEIETEKATVELQAEFPGTVGRLLIRPGTSVGVGEPIAVLVEAGEDEASIDKQIASAGGASHSLAEHPVPEDSEAPTTRRDTRLAAPDASQEPSRNAQGRDSRIFGSPLARKLAKELGLDLSSLTGSGPNSRILRRDVEAARTQHAASQERVSKAEELLAAAPTASSQTAAVQNFQDEPLSGMRKAIARRLTESKTTVPHFYVSIDVEMDALLALRKQINQDSLPAGLKATVNDLVLKALGGALVDVPAANASWQGDAIRRYSTVDVSVAIATTDGLLTPVVRGLENLSLSSLGRTMGDYKERAAAGRIRQQELDGGSFSLTNLGMYGTREFSAILNPPQAGILAVGAAEQRPLVRDGQLAVATVMSCTLSADHRVIDGAVAAQLLAAFKARIENPLSILL